jgi:hypothetical protein
VIDDDTLLTMIREEDTPRLDFARYPCHTQAVERHIKLVTEASEVVCGPENATDSLEHAWNRDRKCQNWTPKPSQS